MIVADTHKNIFHHGVVCQTGDGYVDVAVSVSDACHGCKARTICATGDDKQKIMRIKCERFSDFKSGDDVTICIKESSGFTAMFLGYILPFILIFIVLFISLHIGFSELWAGLCSLIAVAIYYLSLYIFRKFIDKKFNFEIYKRSVA